MPGTLVVVGPPNGRPSASAKTAAARRSRCPGVTPASLGAASGGRRRPARRDPYGPRRRRDADREQERDVAVDAREDEEHPDEPEGRRAQDGGSPRGPAGRRGEA